MFHSSSMSIVFFATGLLAVFLFPRVAAQSDATCMLGSFQWTFNSHKQSPCEVAASLLGACTDGAYHVQPLPAQTHYLGPSIDDANPCRCNTVSYSMISACAACQNGTITSWTEWTSNCATVSISSFPDSIPDGTFVPGWAYLDVKTQNTFDPVVAKENANITESTASPQPTAIPETTSSTAAVTPTTSQESPSGSVASDSGSSTNPTGDPHSNAIGGGVVGGILGLAAIIAAIVVWRLHRRRGAVLADAEADAPPDSPANSEYSSQEKALPTLVVHEPPSVGFYRAQGSSVPPGAYSNSTVTGSQRSLQVGRFENV